MIAYNIYKSPLPFEDYTLIASISDGDYRGYIKTLFLEKIDGFFSYGVTAVNIWGESEMAHATAVDSFDPDTQ